MPRIHLLYQDAFLITLLKEQYSIAKYLMKIIQIIYFKYKY